MPNGPGDRSREKARMFAEREISRKLRGQKWAIVRVVTGAKKFEDLISSAADEELILHSWNVCHNDTIIAVFYPGTEEAIDWQRRGGTDPI